MDDEFILLPATLRLHRVTCGYLRRLKTRNIRKVSAASAWLRLHERTAFACGHCRPRPTIGVHHG